MIDALESSAERSFTEVLHDFISVPNVVTYLILIVSVLVIVSIVELLIGRSIDFCGSWQADKINFLKIQNLCFLEFCE